ncbi:outer membrane protein assembly factor BamB family protein [Haloarcula sediminis]|uniref:outer membrane protein assembly factor BamB family protein n=1 Tax=Haloarcula sediminis TaxID=3111777 RepID=UPI002D79EBF7|nr:PQQ-binding-like beta-propeller repeat protein [Haloarcula sp. CK38]
MNRRKYLVGLAGVGLSSISGCSSDNSSTPQTPENQSENTPAIEWESIAAANIGNGFHFPAPVLVDNQLVVVSGLDDAGTIEGYDPDSGERNWSYSTGVDMSSEQPLCVNNSTIVYSSLDGLEAVSVSSGESVWETDTSVRGDIISADGIIYVPTYDGVLALDFDGSELWNVQIESPVYNLAVDSNSVYFKAGTTIHSLNKQNGSSRWEMRSTIEPSVAPVVKDNLLVFALENGEVRAINKNSQELEWSTELTRNFNTPISVGDTSVYAASWSYPLHAINTNNGNSRWTFDPEYAPLSPALEIDETVYLGSDTGVLFALSPSNGNTKWSYDTESAIWAPPTVDDNQLYLTTEAGDIINLKIPQ